MLDNPTKPTEASGSAVGFSPDNMAATLQIGVWKGDLHQHYGKEEAAQYLYVAGFPMSHVVENLDEAIALERGGSSSVIASHQDREKA